MWQDESLENGGTTWFVWSGVCFQKHSFRHEKRKMEKGISAMSHYSEIKNTHMYIFTNLILSLTVYIKNFQCKGYF